MPSHSISAIIAVHDGERTLERALRSVMAQSCPVHDVVVVDDGSTDQSGAVARLFSNVCCVRTDQQGQASALNLGIGRARGDILTFLDADDEWLPHKAAMQLERLSRDAELEMVFGYAEQVVEPSFALGRQGSLLSAKGAILPARLPSAMMIRRSAFERAGAFDPQLRVGMPIEWYARARDAGVRETMLPEVVYRRWIHGENMGIRRASERGEYATILKRILERRRSTGGESS